jgi:hypothetical protein
MEDVQVQVKISKLETRLENLETRFEGFLGELRTELKEIKSNNQIVHNVVNDQTYYKDSLIRAFHRIEKLEETNKDYDAIINKWDGARKLAWILWTIMGSSVALLLLKSVFGVI